MEEEEFSGSLNIHRWAPRSTGRGVVGWESDPCRGSISDSECLEFGVGVCMGVGARGVGY